MRMRLHKQSHPSHPLSCIRSVTPAAFFRIAIYSKLVNNASELEFIFDAEVVLTLILVVLVASLLVVLLRDVDDCCALRV